MKFQIGDIVVNHKAIPNPRRVGTHWFGTASFMFDALEKQWQYRVTHVREGAIKCRLVNAKGIDCWDVMFHPDELRYPIVKKYAKELE